MPPSTYTPPPAGSASARSPTMLCTPTADCATRSSSTRKCDGMMSKPAAVVVSIAALSTFLMAQEPKPVPKDSVRIAIPGCTRGYIFTAGPRTLEEPGNFEIREGMHLRMNGPKKLMAEIKAHEGSMIEITGLMKKGQYRDGVSIGGGVSISPGASAGGGRPGYQTSQAFIDVEGWRQIAGSCPSR